MIRKLWSLVFPPAAPDPVVRFTPDAYARWLLAQRPGEWFFALSEEDQVALATLGAQHQYDQALDRAYALADPEGFEAECYAEADPEADETLLRRQTAAHIAAMLGREEAATMPQEAPEPNPRRSLSGVIKAREEAAAALQAASGYDRQVLGRRPDRYRGGSSGEDPGTTGENSPGDATVAAVPNGPERTRSARSGQKRPPERPPNVREVDPS
jgi:hypothetical protein